MAHFFSPRLVFDILLLMISMKAIWQWALLDPSIVTFVIDDDDVDKYYKRGNFTAKFDPSDGKVFGNQTGLLDWQQTISCNGFNEDDDGNWYIS